MGKYIPFCILIVVISHALGHFFSHRYDNISGHSRALGHFFPIDDNISLRLHLYDAVKDGNNLDEVEHFCIRNLVLEGGDIYQSLGMVLQCIL